MVTKVHAEESARIDGILRRNIESHLFASHLELVPQLNELYELQLAFYESQILNDDEIIRQGAYFARVDEKPTRHFLICRGEPLKLAEHSSSRLKAFFKTNQFKTGYATHGLFPYRGKFHPQMVKALLNIMGLKPGETVLDPMMGSGTTLIEATLMGIHSIGIDASPFCRFMTQAKLDGLRVPLGPVEWALQNAETVFDYFTHTTGHPHSKQQRSRKTNQIHLDLDKNPQRGVSGEKVLGDFLSIGAVRNYILLAFLDSAGYSLRSQRRAPFDQFRAILERYSFVAHKIQDVLQGTESELGQSRSEEGDARKLALQDSQVDGILFSPPYSFAIDYVANDAFHLRSMGVDLHSLKEEMVGIRGSNLKEKYDLYVQDMRGILEECSRVLRAKRFCTVVVGTNSQQLARILDIQPEDVKGIGQLIVDLASESALTLVRRIERQITGMANTMRSEFILVFQKQ